MSPSRYTQKDLDDAAQLAKLEARVTSLEESVLLLRRGILAVVFGLILWSLRGLVSLSGGI